jgi:hypothetical protein
MLPAEIEKPLSRIELQCEAVAAAVASGEPQAIEAGGGALKQMAVDFSALMAQWPESENVGRELRVRMKKLAGRLTIQRENLIRRSVVVERTLHAMVPATRTSASTQAGQYLGAAGRASGAYKSFSA